MLIIISNAELRHFVTPDNRAACEVCGRHERASVRKVPSGWEAAWIEVRTVTWCLDGTDEDLAAAEIYAFRTCGIAHHFPERAMLLHEAHAVAYKEAMARANLQLSK